MASSGSSHDGQVRKGTFFSMRDDLEGEKATRTMLKKGKIEFKNTGDVWEGELVDFDFNEGTNSTFKWVGTMKKKGDEKEKSGVWKCQDTRETYEVLEFICDLETWRKGLEKKKKSLEGRKEEGIGKAKEEEERELVEID